MTNRPLAIVLADMFVQARDLDAPLNERLRAFADAVRLASPVLANAVDRLVHRLQASRVGESAPAIGEQMPPFVLPDQNGRLTSLDGLLERGPVAVAFHRGHWCPYCRLNTHALAQVQCEMEPIGAHIVAITPDLQKFTLALQGDAGLRPFPILTDIDNGYAMSLDLAIWVGTEMRSIMTEAGCDITAFQGNDAWMLPIPATFIVGTDGTITARFIDPDFRKRMDIGHLVEALHAAALS